MKYTGFCPTTAQVHAGTMQAIQSMETEMPDEKLLFRPAEAQHMLGIGRAKFWLLVKEGAFETRKIRSATVVPAESLRRFVESLPKANAA